MSTASKEAPNEELLRSASRDTKQPMPMIDRICRIPTTSLLGQQIWNARDTKWSLTVRQADYSSRSASSSSTRTVCAVEKHGKMLWLPRAAGYKLLKKRATERTDSPFVDNTLDGAPMQDALQFAAKLRDKNPPQVAATKKTLDKLITNYGALLVLPCGFGKTVCGIWLALQLKRRTIIIVHKEPLMTQWRERIEQFAPGAKIGKLQQKTIDVEDRDFVLATVQSLTVRKVPYDSSILDTFGMVIVDECHRMAADKFSQAVPQFKAKYRLGLSATPDRRDGLTPILLWHIGDVAYRATRVFEEVNIQRVIYTKGCRTEIRMKNGKLNIPRMITRMAADQQRNELILDQINWAIAQGRKTLVLSSRVDQISKLVEAINRKWPVSELTDCPTAAKYVGGMKPEARTDATHSKVIVATYKCADDGLDIPSLDTLVLATTRSNLEQPVGRILRVHPNKQTPMVIEIVDNFSIFSGMAHSHTRWYSEMRYNVETGPLPSLVQLWERDRKQLPLGDFDTLATDTTIQLTPTAKEPALKRARTDIDDGPTFF